MRTLSFPRLLLGTSLLALLAACGGGGGGGSATTPATKLTYTNNPATTTADWRLEADPASNGTGTLLLHVFGPTGTPVKGATVYLTCAGSHAAWSRPAGASDPCVLNGTALDLGQGPDSTVQLFKSRLAGSSLQVGAYQKSGTATLDASTPLFTVALSLKNGAVPGSEGLVVTTGKTAIYLDDAGEHALPLMVGTLAAE